MQVPCMHQMSLKYYACVVHRLTLQCSKSIWIYKRMTSFKMHLNDAVILDVTVNTVSSL
jgi:hypothetical protein